MYHGIMITNTFVMTFSDVQMYLKCLHYWISFALVHLNSLHVKHVAPHRHIVMS